MTEQAFNQPNRRIHQEANLPIEKPHRSVGNLMHEASQMCGGRPVSSEGSVDYFKQQFDKLIVGKDDQLAQKIDDILKSRRI